MTVFDGRIEARLRRAALAPHHAYLFEGVAGVGKREAARWFVALLQCEADGERPCGVCRTCRETERGVHQEISVLADDGASIKIETVRELRRFLGLSRIGGRYRVTIVEEARRLTREAEAALLKTLEEPAEGVVIILTDSTGELSETVVSRCQRFRFSPLSPEVIRARFPALSEEHYRLVAGRAALAERLVKGGEEVTLHQNRLERLEQMLEGDLVERFTLAEELAVSERPTGELAEWLVLLHGRLPESERREELSARMEAIEAARRDLERGANARLVFEELALLLGSV